MIFNSIQGLTLIDGYSKNEIDSNYIFGVISYAVPFLTSIIRKLFKKSSKLEILYYRKTQNLCLVVC